MHPPHQPKVLGVGGMGSGGGRTFLEKRSSLPSPVFFPTPSKNNAPYIRSKPFAIMYKNNMITAIALWRTPKGHCAEAEDSVRRREILLPSKRPMTEERESAPNQAPDTDQATHQRPPQASLARRYMGKLLANIATVPVYLIMEAVLPRALGPQV